MYDIKQTQVKETSGQWFFLMTLGWAIDEKAPSYLLQSLGWSYHAPYAGHDGYNSPWDKYSIRIRTFSSPITGIC